MSNQPPSLSYAPKERRRIAPSRSDCYVAMFLMISAIAGVIGVVGVIGLVLIWFAPASLGFPEGPSGLYFGLGLALYGGALTIAFFAGRLVRRRLRPADGQQLANRARTRAHER